MSFLITILESESFLETNNLTFSIKSEFKKLRYRQLSNDKLQPSNIGQLEFPIGISRLTIAIFKSVGSLPIAKQNRTTCITGSAKTNSNTL